MKINTTHTRINDRAECVGKTIVDYVFDRVQAVGFRFTDGTYYFAKAEAGPFSGDGPEINDTDSDFEGPTEALNLGIIDEAEHARIVAEKAAEDEKWERAKYEAMRAKFEGKAT